MGSTTGSCSRSRWSVAGRLLAGVGGGAEVPQLVGVDDRPDRLDLPVGDVDREDGDQPALRVEQQRAGLAVDLGGLQLTPPIRAAARNQASSVRATLARPCTGWASAGALPPPSPWSTTSWARSSSSASRSPSTAAAKKRRASTSRRSRDASKRGRPSCTCRRARVTSWRVLSSLLPTIRAI